MNTLGLNLFLHSGFAAQAAKVPFPDFYLNWSAAFTRGHGVNFAVAGATALPSYVLAEMNISNPATNSSLDTQLDWMFSYFNGICLDKTGNIDCPNRSNMQFDFLLFGEELWIGTRFKWQIHDSCVGPQIVCRSSNMPCLWSGRSEEVTTTMHCFKARALRRWRALCLKLSRPSRMQFK